MIEPFVENAKKHLRAVEPMVSRKGGKDRPIPAQRRPTRCGGGGASSSHAGRRARSTTRRSPGRIFSTPTRRRRRAGRSEACRRAGRARFPARVRDEARPTRSPRRRAGGVEASRNEARAGRPGRRLGIDAEASYPFSSRKGTNPPAGPHPISTTRAGVDGRRRLTTGDIATSQPSSYRTD